jgi:hypothetical protein
MYEYEGLHSIVDEIYSQVVDEIYEYWMISIAELWMISSLVVDEIYE